MKPAALFFILSSVTLAARLTGTTVATAAPSAAQAIELERALGKWHSTERFEDEPRITVALRRKGRSLEGWALLLGQHRKSDDRATLGLSFSEAQWDGQRFLFSTILPEDEGTIGWELRIATPTTAVLTALTEDGQPIQDELKWEMKR
jgi:hypothetical protein